MFFFCFFFVPLLMVLPPVVPHLTCTPQSTGFRARTYGGRVREELPRFLALMT